MTERQPLKDAIQEALEIIDEAKKRGIVLRLMGACAFMWHCPTYKRFFSVMKREISDIDFMSYSKFRGGCKKLFIESGYAPREFLITVIGANQHVYDDPANGRVVDVFFDGLDMCHKIDFRGRLELSYPTITLSDLLLEKLQIVKLAEKDMTDLSILLREHEIGYEETEEALNLHYLSKLLSNDWGFYYTALQNLKKIKSFSESEKLSKEDIMNIKNKVDTIINKVEDSPKSLKWKLRSRVGTRTKWYREVSDK